MQRENCMLGIGMILLSALLLAPKALFSADGEGGKPGCCRAESAKISQLHKNVDRLYGQFKAKEAVAELQNIDRDLVHRDDALRRKQHPAPADPIMLQAHVARQHRK